MNDDICKDPGTEQVPNKCQPYDKITKHIRVKLIDFESEQMRIRKEGIEIRNIFEENDHL